jgi:hypothetical protein
MLAADATRVNAPELDSMYAQVSKRPVFERDL